MLTFKAQIRDVLISASIGRPPLTWQGYCDVELPCTLDLADAFDDATGESASYFLSMAELSNIGQHQSRVNLSSTSLEVH